LTIDERFQLRGKVAVVIGGLGYLCSTLSRALVESGCTVVILDVTEPAVSDPSANYLRCDITSKADLIRCRDGIVERYGRVDILLNAAGANAPTPFLDISDDEIQRIISVNLTGVIYSCQAFGEVMVEQKRGSIINFASVSSGPPLSKAFIYSVAKAGVVSITQNLAREWARSNVRVNAIRPGFFPTQWSMENFIDADRKAKILTHTPMGRFGQPEELIGAILWLASEAAGFVTGSVISVDGGFTAMTI
jgi:NAD(P)-dependent dehydrogenase (short-subunit alcohol dehydrogenase family)